MIKKILIANRGEIAVRIMRTCREMGIISIAVFSEADRTSMHVRYADEAYCIGPSPSAESYLNIDKIIQVAIQSHADAIHPGYGFLSENAMFAKLVTEQEIIFIGPSSKAILSMGNKITARTLMIQAGIPIVPGTQKALGSISELHEVADEIGYPIMLKASAGGGGKGMRLVQSEIELEPAYEMAKSESKSAFGDDTVYIEKYITSPHHIEFQILADQYGHTIHLFERECSVQRRHQKVIEETPSPLMTPHLRLDEQHNFYFLEMNTRLQVEHPITEHITGIDIVKEQIKIANGEKLQYNQSEIQMRGHAMECRIYAEDPDDNFRPVPGKIQYIVEPQGIGVRTDSYVYKNYTIPSFYDPLISKLIVTSATRLESINRMKRALHEYQISGIKTSIPFLEKILETPEFIKGKYNTHFIENNSRYLLTKSSTQAEEEEDIALLVTYIHNMKMQKLKTQVKQTSKTSAWKEFGRKQNLLRL
jgi:acetyl-CoA carboxylase biotin carboxylase subunit